MNPKCNGSVLLGDRKVWDQITANNIDIISKRGRVTRHIT